MHISGAAYFFFLSLEQERVNSINFSKLAQLQKDMVDQGWIQTSATSFRKLVKFCQT